MSTTSNKRRVVEALVRISILAEEVASLYRKAWSTQGGAQHEFGVLAERLPLVALTEAEQAALDELRAATAASLLIQVDTTKATQEAQDAELTRICEIGRAAKALAEQLGRMEVLQ